MDNVYTLFLGGFLLFSSTHSNSYSKQKQWHCWSLRFENPNGLPLGVCYIQSHHLVNCIFGFWSRQWYWSSTFPKLVLDNSKYPVSFSYNIKVWQMNNQAKEISDIHFSKNTYNIHISSIFLSFIWKNLFCHY